MPDTPISRLRWFRERRGLSIAKLAEMTGMSRQAVWQLERGETRPTLATAQGVALVLGVSVDTLWPVLDGELDRLTLAPHPDADTPT